MKASCALFFLSVIIFFSSCSVTKNYNANKKYDPQTLRDDYTLLRNILEAKHPSLYWYTPKDSMEVYFDKGYKSITDSMTELQFGWGVIAPLLSNIHCGHTSFSMSKGWNHFIRNKRIPSFPLFLKTWSDSMVVIGNLDKKDSLFKKGTIITAVNDIRNKELLKYMYGFLSQDGYENNINNLRLSTGFPYYHRNIFGLYKNYSINYIDSKGNEKRKIIHYFDPTPDTSKKAKDSLKTIQKNIPEKHQKHLTRKERLNNLRSLTIKQQENTATISLSTFSKGGLKTFFNESFQKIHAANIKNLVIDIRGNGGGEISNYVALTRYIRNSKFRVSDTSFAKVRSLAPYTGHIRQGFITNIGLKLLTRKKEGEYHFRYWERHLFTPKKINHFNGNVYVLTNGFTFSASALFCNALKGQQNVKIIGENTGGGWYGNSGIFIPEIILPNTKLRVRLPLFRIVQYNHPPIKGTGILPDIRVDPTVKSIIENKDLKLEKVKELIRNNK
ncbi:MAG: hypothetical protein NVS3B19_09480 [Ginsengibacter sp.]